MNFARNLLEALNASSTSIFFENNDVSITGGDFLRLVYNRQKYLRSEVTCGDMVVIKAGRGFAFFVDMVAVWGLGGVIVPLSPEAEQDYCDHVVATVEPSAILQDIHPLEMEGRGSTPECVAIAPGSTAAVLFTSGSTGTPKGVVLTHEVLAGNSYGILDVLKMERDRLFINIPFNFTSAICHCLACILSGSTLIGIEEKLFFNELARTAWDKSATGFGGAPIQLKWMAQTYQGMVDAGINVDAKLRFVMSSGDRLPLETITALRKILPHTEIYTVYGLTELGGRFTILDAEFIDSHPGSVGKPIQGLHAKVVDFSAMKEVGPNEEGEIVANGSLLCKGYYREPEKTEKLFSEWGLRTGDIGYIDEEGFIYVTGRSDDVFKVNGQKVSATVISDTVLKLPIFLDAAATSVETEAFGTVPAVAYVLKTGEVFRKGEALKALRKKLPTNHIPHIFLEVKEIPRTPSGKIERSTLREKVLESVGEL